MTSRSSTTSSDAPQSNNANGEAPPPLFTAVSALKGGHDARVIAATKAAARSEIQDWSKAGWAWAWGRTNVNPPQGGNPIPREGSSLSVADFRARYESPCLPVVVAGLADGWAATPRAGSAGAWHPDALYKAYRHRKFRVGEDDDGRPVKVKLKYFLRYASSNRDDSPLYVFDSMWADSSRVCEILSDYAVPHLFPDDLFSAVGESRRPPYRWLLLGPCRSGTKLHIDPLATSAWNTLIAGRKRWILFPPDVPGDAVKGRPYKKAGEDDEAVDYFLTLLPRLKSTRPDLAARCIEFVQEPGETVFVPGGWWHAVLNLEDTIAITQNFCSTVNLPLVWRAVRRGRPGMARKWLRLLRANSPALAAVVEAINVSDGWDLAREAARHRARVAAKPPDASSDSSESSGSESEEEGAQKRGEGMMG